MPEGISLVCPRCDRTVAPGDGSCCPADGAVLELSEDIAALREQFDPADASRTDIWRYVPLLPVSGEPVTLGEGWTELVDAPTAGAELGVDLRLKLEGANPTGSAKDRGSAVVATHARERDRSAVVCASTGNAAASIAAYAARGGLDCSLFVPERLPEAKAVQPLVSDASLVTVEGGYAAAFEECESAAANREAIDRSAGANPYTPAGAQTLGFELAEQTDQPAWIVVPMGNGGTIADLWRGYELFESLGYVEQTPRLLGVQAAGSSTIHHNSSSGTERSATATDGTCADSIDVSVPHRTEDACRAIEASGGETVTVPDDQIKAALTLLGRTEGVFVEPASAAGLAGITVARSRGIVDGGERVVAVMTGTGLKDTATANEAVQNSG